MNRTQRNGIEYWNMEYNMRTWNGRTDHGIEDKNMALNNEHEIQQKNIEHKLKTISAN